MREHFQSQLGRRGREQHAEWNQLVAGYQKKFPEVGIHVDCMPRHTLPPDWDQDLPVFPPDPKGVASRDASAKAENAIAQRVPWLLGGSADLWPSTKTLLTFEGAGEFQAPGHGGDYGGRNFHFGVREHAMCAFVNGMALSGLRPFGSSFLVFTDYCRGALRIGALMEVPSIFIWTHDSINLGEDGPTHQPIEHLASLRAMPGMIVLRPADANEVVEAWRVIMGIKDRPVCLVLSRQSLPTFDRTKYAAASGVARGAYILAEAPSGKPDVLLLSTGSEVSLCLAAREQARGRGHRRPGGQHAVVGDLRGATGGVPRQRVAAGDRGPGLGGSRLHLRVGAVHRPQGRNSGNAHLRPLGPDESRRRALRVRARARRRCRAGASGCRGRAILVGAERDLQIVMTTYRQQAAERAVELVKSGMTVGLGTGETATYAIRRIGALLRAGKLEDIEGVATSLATAAEAVRLGIPLLEESRATPTDITIDGADEIDPALNLIKGRGGALLREKIVAQTSARVVIVADHSKLSPVLGTRGPLPVEVVPFGSRYQPDYLKRLMPQAQISFRLAPGGSPFRTDQGNFILDCSTGPIERPEELAAQLQARAGVVAHGLFLGLATDVIVAGPAGVEHRTRR